MNHIKYISFLTILFSLIYFSIYNQEFKSISSSLAIFLFGIMFMEQSFKNFDSYWIKEKLEKFSNSTRKGVLLSTSTSIITQSGSLVILLTISFVSVGIISLSNSIGLIIGSNIGATFSPWLLSSLGSSLSLSEQSYFLITIGAFFYIQKNKNIKTIGGITIAIGFIFLGIGEIKDNLKSLEALNHIEEAKYSDLKTLLISFFIGTAITFLIFSSNAVIMLTFILLSIGQISLEVSLMLALGANIGASITPILSSIGGNYEGRRVAIIHFLLNLFGVIIFLVLFQYFLFLTLFITDLFGFNLEFSVLIFHSLFNVISSLMLYYYKNLYIRIATKIIKEPKKYNIKLKYLTTNTIKEENIFLIALTKEIKSNSNTLSGIFFKKLKAKVEGEDKIKLENFDRASEVPKLFRKTMAPIIKKINNILIKAKDENPNLDSRSFDLAFSINSQFEDTSNDLNAIIKKIKDIKDEEIKNSIRMFILEYIYKIQKTFNESDNYEEFLVDYEFLLKSIKKDIKENNIFTLSTNIDRNEKSKILTLNSLIHKFLKDYSKINKDISRINSFNTPELDSD